MPDVVQFSYLHDGGPFVSLIIIEKEGFKDGMYHLNIALSDPTDYERLKSIVEFPFSKFRIVEHDA